MRIKSMFHIASLDFIGNFENRSAARKIAKTRKAEDENDKSSERVLNKHTSSTEESSKKAKDDKNNKKENVQADMTNPNMHIKDKNPNVIDLGFGVKINTNIDTTENPSVVPNPAAGFVQQPTINPMQPNPAMMQQPPITQPNGHQQAVHQEVNPIKQNPAVAAYDNAYLEYLQKQQQAAAVTVGRGNHQVDNPKPPKPPVIKSEKDDVNIDLNAIKVETNPPKPKKEWPDICTPVMTNPNPQVIEEQKAFFDNTLLKNKYKYLTDIEKIGLENGVQVKFIERLGLDGNPNGLIDVVSYTGNMQPNEYKCFTIDTGCLYDKRAKVFPGIFEYGYENINAYPVLVPKKEDDVKGKSKSKNEVNSHLFADIFKGGIHMLDKVRGMYSNELMELNRNVALITTPTKNMDADTRKKVRDRLFAAMQSGVFAKALDIEPNSRFMFKSYDKKTGCFTLTNRGVPKYFGTVCVSKNIVEINFGIDQTTVNKIA